MTWFVVQTKPRSEDIARLNLERQGFAAYLPKVNREVRHARRVSSAAYPLFPGYLFVEIDTEHHRWRSVNGTIGAIGLLCFGNRPAPVPEGIVDGLKECEENGYVTLLPAEISAGDLVRVVSGPFADYVGLIEEISSEERVVLLLTILGRDVRVSAERRALAAA